MGRKRLYHSQEEKAAAVAERSARHYKKVNILAARKAKYVRKPPGAQRAPQRRLPPTPLTDEERKAKDNLKSKRCYERNKSNNKWARNSKKKKYVPWSLIHSANVYQSAWNKSLSQLNDLVTNALKGESLPLFVDGVALQYIETGLRGPLDDAPKPFIDILRKVDEHETRVLNELGAGIHLGDIAKVRNHVRHIVELLEHLVIVALEKETVSGFLEVYEEGDLMHHLIYFE